MQSLVDNLSLFNYRELLVRARHRHTIAGSLVALQSALPCPRVASLALVVTPVSAAHLNRTSAKGILCFHRWAWRGSWSWRCANSSAASTVASFTSVPLARCWCALVHHAHAELSVQCKSAGGLPQCKSDSCRRRADFPDVDRSVLASGTHLALPAAAGDHHLHCHHEHRQVLQGALQHRRRRQGVPW